MYAKILVVPISFFYTLKYSVLEVLALFFIIELVLQILFLILHFWYVIKH